MLPNDIFRDIYNPTGRELRNWAYTPGAFFPCQDWDIIAGNYSNIVALAELACEDIPNRQEILILLYAATAHSFKFDKSRKTLLDAIAKVPDNTTVQEVSEWKVKAQHLLDNPTSFMDREWYLG